MRNTQFTIGMRVRLREDRDCKGEVISACKHTVEVKWDRKGIREEELSDVMEDSPEVDRARAAKVQPLIDLAAKTLEEAFQLWRSAKQTYTDEGGGYDNYMAEDNDIDIKKFAGALEANGWSSSSLFC